MGDSRDGFTLPEDVPTNDAGETLQSTEETLAQRGNRYGEFSGNAEVSCTLRDTLSTHYSICNQGEPMPLVQREAINLICHKLSRIVNGDVTYDDNWRDIAGYATLVVEHLNDTTNVSRDTASISS